MSSSFLRRSRLSWLGWSTPRRERTMTRDVLSFEFDGINIHRVSIAFKKGWLPVVALLSSIGVEGKCIPPELLFLINLLLMSNQSVDPVVVGVKRGVGHQETSSDGGKCILFEVHEGHVIIYACFVPKPFKSVTVGGALVVFTLLALGHLVEEVLL